MSDEEWARFFDLPHGPREEDVLQAVINLAGPNHKPPSKEYQCIVCRKVLSGGRSLIDHYRHHAAATVKPYRCTICMFVAATSRSIKKHIMDAHNKKTRKWTASEDTNMFDYGQFVVPVTVDEEEQREKVKEMAIEKGVYTRSKPLQCALCKEMQLDSRSLHLHHLSHTGVYPWKCALCGHGAIIRMVVWRHVKMHFKATYISQDSMKNLALVESARLRTADAPQQTVQCTLCEKECSTDAVMLRAHYISHSGTTYRCPACPFSTFVQSELMEHTEGHLFHSEQHDQVEFKQEVKQEVIQEPESVASTANFSAPPQQNTSTDTTPIAPEPKEPVSCPRCSASFDSKAGLKSHMWSCVMRSESWRTYLDLFIESTPIDQDSMSRRLRAMAGNNPQPLRAPTECIVCRKIFKNNRTLTCHQRIHLGVRPYKCTICSYNMFNKSAVRRHIKGVHTEECQEAIVKLLGKVEAKKKAGGGMDNSSFVESVIEKQIRRMAGPDAAPTTHDNECILCREILEDRAQLMQHYTTHTENGAVSSDDEVEEGDVEEFLNLDLRKVVKEPGSDLRLGLQNAQFIKLSDWDKYIERLPYDEKEEERKIEALRTEDMQPVTNPNQCVICRIFFTTKRQLMQHYTIHTETRAWRCKLCRHRARNKPMLKEHILGVHVGKEGFRQHFIQNGYPPPRNGSECPVCFKKLGSHVRLYFHFRQHVNEAASENFPCTECGRKLLTRAALTAHRLTHEPKKQESVSSSNSPDPVDIAVTLVEQAVGLVEYSEQPVEREEEPLPESPVPSTSKTSVNSVNFMNWEAPAPAAMDALFPCSQCDEKFLTRAALDAHLLLHATIRQKYDSSRRIAKKKKFKDIRLEDYCANYEALDKEPVSSASIAMKVSLPVVQVAPEVPALPSPSPSTSALTNNYADWESLVEIVDVSDEDVMILMREMADGNSVAMFTGSSHCMVCGLKNDSQDQLMQHYREHAGIKPFKCLHCDVAFDSRDSVREHVTTQHSFNEIILWTQMTKPQVVKKRSKSRRLSTMVSCEFCGKVMEPDDKMVHMVVNHTEKVDEIVKTTPHALKKAAMQAANMEQALARRAQRRKRAEQEVLYRMRAKEGQMAGNEGQMAGNEGQMAGNEGQMAGNEGQMPATDYSEVPSEKRQCVEGARLPLGYAPPSGQEDGLLFDTRVKTEIKEEPMDV